MEQIPLIVWFVAMLVFLTIEAGTVGLVSIWFSVGALAGLLAAALGASVPVQIIVFVAVAAACLAGLRPMVRKYITPRLVRTNVDAIVGKEAVVTEDIDNLQARGAVKVGAVTWTARSTTGKVIPAGAVIRIDRVEGVKLFVSLAEVTAKQN